MIPHVRRRCTGAALVLAVAALIACSDVTSEAPDAGAASNAASEPGVEGWTSAQLSLLESISLDALPAPPAQPSNRVADDPRAAALGHRLFFAPELSSNGRVSCATCHVPERFFTDGRRVSQGIGETSRNAPTVVGAAHAPWQFWDGRRDSLWSQALAPLEAGVEMNTTRVEVARLVSTDPELRTAYLETFGEAALTGDLERFPARASPFGERATRDAWSRMPARDRRQVDRVFANVGKAIAAYERRLQPGETRFDRYVRSLRQGSEARREARLGERELAGLRLFVEDARTQCLRCHNGPLLTNQSFHRVGTAQNPAGLPEFGRFLGLQAVLVDPFNCLGPQSDARPDQCQELQFLNRDHVSGETGKFKTPTLRGLPRTAPYMHDGRFATLSQVVEHYRDPPPRGPDPHELLPLDLSPEEQASLVAFLETLDGPVGADPGWLSPPSRSEMLSP